MRGILADINIQGHFETMLERVLQSEEWGPFWSDLHLTVESFESLGLELAASDEEISVICQEREVVFITANRNHQGADSLEATIRIRNTEISLPVITISDPDRFRSDRAYIELLAVRLLDFLLDIEHYLGCGRKYLP